MLFITYWGVVGQESYRKGARKRFQLKDDIMYVWGGTAKDPQYL